MNALVEEAHTLRRKAAAHAHGAEAAKRAIRAGIDSIEHGTFLDDEALRMMHERGVFLVPTLTTRVGLMQSKLPPLVRKRRRARWRSRMPWCAAPWISECASRSAPMRAFTLTARTPRSSR